MDDRYQNWYTAISAYSSAPHKGFICIDHFHKDDLQIGKSKTTLKKNALPKIFAANDTSINIQITQVKTIKKTNDVISSAPSVSSICDTNKNNSTNKRQVSGIIDAVCPVETCTAPKQCTNVHKTSSCDNCEILKAEKKHLYQEYIELETKRCVEVEFLKKKIKNLEMDAEIRKQHMKYLSNKVFRKEKSEESLKILLKDLKEQNVLSLQAYETLEVCILFFKAFLYVVLLYDNYEFFTLF